MTESNPLRTRRSVIVGALAAAGTSASIVSDARAAPQSGKPATDDRLKFTGNLGDWAFLVGTWKVRHRRLKERLDYPRWRGQRGRQRAGTPELRDRPVKARFQWSQITPTSAHWEQAFSPDGGATWEINWRMEFTRVAR